MCIIYLCVSNGYTMKALMAQQLSLQEIDSATQVQILIKAVCISHSTNTLRESMNPTILPSATDK